jgi:hypothetical protein
MVYGLLFVVIPAFRAVRMNGRCRMMQIREV